MDHRATKNSPASDASWVPGPVLRFLRSPRAPTIVFGGALFAMAVVLVLAQWRVTFFQDTFAFLLDRQPWTLHSIVFPHNEHFVAIPVIVTKVLLAIFGMTSNVPEQVVMGITVLLAAVLLFIWLRRRVDPWLAMIAATLFLFLGSAWPTIIWPFENEFTFPVVFGMAALLFLDRKDDKGDAWASAMLVLAVLSGSLGVCFVVGAFVDLLLEHRDRGWRRAYVFAVPTLVYLAWYAVWGHSAEHHITLMNVLHSPQYVMEGFGSSLQSLTGLSTIPAGAPGNTDWGRPLAIGAIALFAFAQWRRPGYTRTFWVVTSLAVSYWLLAAFDFVPGREASAPRYIYAGALFVLLMIAELLINWPFSRKALWIAAAVAALAIGPNLVQLKEGGSWEKNQSVLTRADLGALEIARDHVSPEFQLLSVESTGTASLGLVEAGLWFEAVDKWGTFADTPSQIETEPEGGKEHADLVLAEALPISSAVEPGGLGPSGPAGTACTTLPGGSVEKEVLLKPGTTTVEVAPGDAPVIALRRFATERFPVSVSAEGGATTAIDIPKDRASQPWFLHVEAGQEARVCTGA
ncbi:MAG: hypothetical protein JST53_18255 [Actinobacteria bacterium]|nr:hypothetical protein [Actinomycetota bacterium]